MVGTVIGEVDPDAVAGTGPSREPQYPEQSTVNLSLTKPISWDGKDTRNGILCFLKRAERLKDACRFAYTSNGRTESAAAHTWWVCLLAVVLEEQYPRLDSGRLLKLCLVHDLGEALGEDVPAPEQDEGREAGGESENERRALLALVDPLPEALKEKIVAL